MTSQPILGATMADIVYPIISGKKTQIQPDGPALKGAGPLSHPSS